jgi:hypothetical protein
MGVRIHKSWYHDFVCAIDFDKLFAILLHPGIAERIAGLADSNDLAACANDSSIFDGSEFAQVFAAPRARRTQSQRHQLPDV